MLSYIDVHIITCSAFSTTSFAYKCAQRHWSNLLCWVLCLNLYNFDLCPWLNHRQSAGAVAFRTLHINLLKWGFCLVQSFGLWLWECPPVHWWGGSTVSVRQALTVSWDGTFTAVYFCGIPQITLDLSHTSSGLGYTREDSRRQASQLLRNWHETHAFLSIHTLTCHSLYFSQILITTVTSIKLHHFNIDTGRNQASSEAACHMQANQIIVFLAANQN